MQHGRHLVLIGPMGSGKSTLGSALAARLQRPFIDLDARIAAAAGMSIPAIFTDEGEPGFRDRESRALLEALDTPPSVIATGGGAVMRDANRSAMRRAGWIAWLDVAPEVQLARIADDDNRPLLGRDAPAQALAELQALREPIYRALADFRLDTGVQPPARLVELLATAFRQHEDSRA